jgi:cytochrome bd-type quinol oxidase subunit 2
MIAEKSVGRLRTVALIAMGVGIAGSVGLFLRAGQRTPRLLLAVMAIWMLSPFLALGWADTISKRWTSLTKVTLHVLMIVVALASLLVYGDDALGHRRAQAAFVYVILPPVSWLVIATTLAIAAYISRIRPHRGDNSRSRSERRE